MRSNGRPCWSNSTASRRATPPAASSRARGSPAQSPAAPRRCRSPTRRRRRARRARDAATRPADPTRARRPARRRGRHPRTRSGRRRRAAPAGCARRRRRRRRGRGRNVPRAGRRDARRHEARTGDEAAPRHLLGERQEHTRSSMQRAGCDERATAALPIDQTGVGQHLERLAHRHPTDAEALAELGLGREHVACRSGCDQPLQVLLDLAVAQRACWAAVPGVLTHGSVTVVGSPPLSRQSSGEPDGRTGSRGKRVRRRTAGRSPRCPVARGKPGSYLAGQGDQHHDDQQAPREGRRGDGRCAGGLLVHDGVRRTSRPRPPSPTTPRPPAPRPQAPKPPVAASSSSASATRSPATAGARR